MRQSLGVVGILRFVIGNSHIRHRLPIFMFHDDDVVFWQGPPLGPPRSQSSARFAVAPSGMDTAQSEVRAIKRRATDVLEKPNLFSGAAFVAATLGYRFRL
jgi:hypothetical protein